MDIIKKNPRKSASIRANLREQKRREATKSRKHPATTPRTFRGGLFFQRISNPIIMILFFMSKIDSYFKKILTNPIIHPLIQNLSFLYQEKIPSHKTIPKKRPEKTP